MARDTQLLNDELDVLRHTADKANKLEATIEAYKIKLEEMSDLRSQIKLLEGSNTKYMETIIQMEEVCVFAACCGCYIYICKEIQLRRPLADFNNTVDASTL
jgi:hypothetical protein